MIYALLLPLIFLVAWLFGWIVMKILIGLFGVFTASSSTEHADPSPASGEPTPDPNPGVYVSRLPDGRGVTEYEISVLKKRLETGMDALRPDEGEAGKRWAFAKAYQYFALPPGSKEQLNHAAFEWFEGNYGDPEKIDEEALNGLLFTKAILLADERGLI